jgi:hypothetical protein
MNGHSRIRLSLSAVVIIGVLMVFGQTSAFAQSAEPQGNGATPAQLGSFLLFGGAYQQVDAATGLCTGQCGVINQWTGGKPFIGDPKARTAPLVLGRDRRGATDPRRITAHERQRRSCAHIFCLRPGALIAYWAVEPPSMTNSLPVTYEDSSEARYSTP